MCILERIKKQNCSTISFEKNKTLIFLEKSHPFPWKVFSIFRLKMLENIKYQQYRRADFEKKNFEKKDFVC